MDKENILKFVDEILEKYYWAEMTCINEFSITDAENSEEELEQEVNEYKSKIKILINL